MGGVFVVQAERTKRKPARREYKPTSRRQPLMNPPSEIHSRRIANPVTAPQDASHFLPNTWPAWWRVFARPARAIYTGQKVSPLRQPCVGGVLDSFRCASYVADGLMALSDRECQAFIITNFSTNARRAAAAMRVIMAKLKFRPLHDRVVVKRIEAEEKSKGGIIIPDTVKEKPQEGEIVAVGPGGRDENGKLIAMDLKAGDRVLFGKWSGTEVKLEGEDLLIMKESDIMGVIA
jgi:chaperonin GroES